MVCLGSIWAGGKQGEGESEEVKWGSLMMTRLDVARQTVSFCLTHTPLEASHYTHTHSDIAAYTQVGQHAQGHPFLIVEELLALQGLKLQEQLIPLTPCKPSRLCWESELPCIHTGDSSTPRAALLTLPGTSSTHTSAHTSH